MLTQMLLFILLPCGIFAQTKPTGCLKVGRVLLCDQMPYMDQLASTDFLTIKFQKMKLHRFELGSNKEKDSPSSAEQISLRHTRIDFIEDGFFARLSKSVKSLFFEDVHGPFELNARTFGGLEDSLEQLDIVGSIRINKDFVSKFSKLKELQVTNAYISGYPTEFDRILSTLEYIKFENTTIQQLPWAQLAQWTKRENARYLSLQDSAIHCDAGIVTFRAAVETARKSLKLADVVCQSPPKFKGRKLVDISEQELLATQDLPDANVFPGFVKQDDTEAVQTAQISVTILCVMGALLGVALLCIVGYLIYRRKQGDCSKLSAENHHTVKVNTTSDDRSRQSLLAGNQNV